MEEELKKEYFENSHDPDLMEFALEEFTSFIQGESDLEQKTVASGRKVSEVNKSQLPIAQEGAYSQVLIDHDDSIKLVEAEGVTIQTEESIFARSGKGYSKPHNVSADPLNLMLLPEHANHKPGEDVSKCIMTYRNEDILGYIEALGAELEQKFPTEVEFDDETTNPISRPSKRFSYCEDSTEVWYSQSPDFRKR